MEYGWIFVAGAASSMHCVGMCGGFALALGLHRGQPVVRQVLYNLGRVNALVAMGAVCGAAGAILLASAQFAIAESVLAVLAGMLMLVIGVEGLGWNVGITASAAQFLRGSFGPALGGVTRSDSLAAPIAFGVFNAFLPCGLIYAFAARAASTGSAVDGALTMLAFGLGTVPAMLAVGVAGQFIGPRLRMRLAATGSILVLGFAFVTICRGLGIDAYGLVRSGTPGPACEHHGAVE